MSAHKAQLILAEEIKPQTSFARRKHDAARDCRWAAAFTICNPSLSPHSSSVSALPSSALRFVCFSFSSLFRGSRPRRRVCWLPDANTDYWINSSTGSWASQRLEVRDVINSQPSPFAHREGAGAIDLEDSAGSCSHITARRAVGNKSIYIFWCLLLSNEKEAYATLTDMYMRQGEKCSVCEMLQPFQQQRASSGTPAHGPGEHSVNSDGDQPLAMWDTLLPAGDEAPNRAWEAQIPGNTLDHTRWW